MGAHKIMLAAPSPPEIRSKFWRIIPFQKKGNQQSKNVTFFSAILLKMYEFVTALVISTDFSHPSLLGSGSLSGGLSGRPGFSLVPRDSKRLGGFRTPRGAATLPSTKI